VQHVLASRERLTAALAAPAALPAAQSARAPRG